MKRSILFLAALIMGLGLQSASADEEQLVAKELYKSGKEAFAAGHFELAVERYTAAYDLSPSPALLFNIGLAYHRSGKVRKALSYYELYVEQAPDGVASQEAREYIDQIRAAIDSDPSSGGPAPKEPETAEQSLAEAPPAVSSRGSRGLRYAGWSSLAIGALALGVSAKYGYDARSSERELEQWEGAWPEDLQERVRDAESDDRLMVISASVGGAALLAGVVLLWAGTGEESPPLAVGRLGGRGISIGWVGEL